MKKAGFIKTGLMKNLCMPYFTNTYLDQPVQCASTQSDQYHLAILAMSKFSVSYLVSVAEHTGIHIACCQIKKVCLLMIYLV